MIKPCIVHSAAKVHYHEYSIPIRKFSFETSVNLAQIFCILATYIGQYVCDPGLSRVGSRAFNNPKPWEITKCPRVKKGAVKKKRIIIWHHHISTLFSSTLLVRSIATPSESGPQQCRVQSLNLCVKIN